MIEIKQIKAQVDEIKSELDRHNQCYRTSAAIYDCAEELEEFSLVDVVFLGKPYIGEVTISNKYVNVITKKRYPFTEVGRHITYDYVIHLYQNHNLEKLNGHQ